MNSDISIVIPSIGGEVLLKTISFINSGTLVPKEIIVVVPNEFIHRIPNLTLPNLHFEVVGFKGQVAQRAHGFKIAKSDFVMQLDDDICVDSKCIEKLLDGLKSLGSGHSVGPSIFYKETNSTVYSLGTGLSKYIKNLKSYFLSGAAWGVKRMGTISSNGVGFGYDYDLNKEEYSRTEWLAGGCVLHFRSGLILESYFPLKGKAYGEDLIHSYLLGKAGVKLYNVKSAICYIEKPVLTRENYSLHFDYKSRLYLNELRGLSKFKVHFWYGARSINNFIKSLIP